MLRPLVRKEDWVVLEQLNLHLITILDTAERLKRHYDRVTMQMSELAADELAYAIDSIERAPSIDDADIRRFALIVDIGMQIEDGPAVRPGVERFWYDRTGGVIAESTAK